MSDESKTLIKIDIDNRETELISVIKNFWKEEIKSTINYLNLDIADIIIYYKNQIIYLIERKTWADLAASIKDGRYKSQKMRLIKHALDHNLNRSAILYLLEGNIPKTKVNGFPVSTLQSACINMQIRDGFRVYNTLNTAEFLKKIYNCLIKYGCYQDLIKRNTEDSIIQSNIQIKKKNNITVENAYIHQLAVIPGVSVTKAKAITKKYRTLPLLINALIDEKTLTDIRLENGRRLGPILSKRIYKYIVKPLDEN